VAVLDLSRVFEQVASEPDTWSITVRLNKGIIERDPIEMVRFLTRIPKDLEIPLRHAVKAARHQGRTWQEIGDAIGLTRQAAWERYATDINDVA
jgi:hypothetical protein